MHRPLVALLLFFAVVARPNPGRADAPPATAGTVSATRRLPYSSAELGFQGTALGGGGSVVQTYLGPVLTVQGGHYAPVLGVFHLGVGALQDEAPDSGRTRTQAVFLAGLGVRLRPLAFLRPGPRRIDLFVGPLLQVFGSEGAVSLTTLGEIGVGLHFGRLRLSLSVHGGWAKILQQEVEDRLKASFAVGGQLALGLRI